MIVAFLLLLTGVVAVTVSGEILLWCAAPEPRSQGSLRLALWCLTSGLAAAGTVVILNTH